MDSQEIAIRTENARKKQRLDWYEDEIKKRAKSLASILVQLRDDRDKPYLLTHKSWEDYCLDRWNMTPRRTLQMTDAENVREQLSAIPETAEIATQLNERQLRELVPVVPEKRAEILSHAVANAGPRGLTARKIKASKVRIIEPEKAAKEPTKCPHCHGTGILP